MAATWLLPEASASPLPATCCSPAAPSTPTRHCGSGWSRACVDDASFRDEVLGPRRGIAATAPIASRLTKLALADGGHASYDAALQWEALAQPVTLATEDLHEGIRAAAREAGAGVQGTVSRRASAEAARPVEDQPLAGDVAGGLGGEERDRVGDVVRGAEPADRGRRDVGGPLVGTDVLDDAPPGRSPARPCSP